MSKPSLALVCSGGGARAAYQAGFIRGLTREFPALQPDIFTGVSAGAINASFLASQPGSMPASAQQLTELWRPLQTHDVFRADMWAIVKNTLLWGVRLLSGGARGLPQSRGLVNTEPLRRFLANALSANEDGTVPGIQKNLDAGVFRALAVTTASYATGQSVTWVQGRDVTPWTRAQRVSEVAPISVAHILASSALPLFFPAVRIGEGWYGDGGIRLAAPLAPAVHLGAKSIIALSTRFLAPSVEDQRSTSPGSYPPPAQVIGTLMNSVFLDMFDQDAQHLERINRVMQHCRPEVAHSEGLRPIELLLMRPSRDLGKLANEFEAQLPKGFRFMTRGLGTRELRSNDALSMVMFQPDYMSRLIEIGEADAYDRREQIAQFLEGRA